MRPRDNRLCRLHSLEHGVFELRPGESLRIGRHEENDLTLNDTMVSRFHARVTWDPRMNHPVVFDNGSQNGTLVDGKSIRNTAPLKHEGRIFSYDWNEYSADRVVYHPKQISAERLQQLLHYAWDTFYHDESQEVKMFKLFQRVIQKEMANDTFRPRNRALASRAFGKAV